MKKTQVKDAVRNIKNRLVSYLSVCLVVMLGLSALYTTRYMGAGINKSATDFFNDHNFKTFEMISSLGITDGNINKISATEGVEAAEGVIQTDGSVSIAGKKTRVKIVSLTEKVSVPSLVEGKLPTGRDQCMVGEDFAETHDVKVGDKVKLSVTGLDMAAADMLAGFEELEAEQPEGMDIDLDEEGAEETKEEEKKEKTDETPLYNKEFTVAGLMSHPDYFRRKATYVVALPKEAYNEEVTKGLYTHAYVRVADPEKTDIFTEEFFEKTDANKKTLEELAEELGRDRSKEVHDEANAYIDEEWAKAEAELEDAQNQIDAGEAELEARLADGVNQLNSAQNKLNKEVAKYNKQIKDGKQKIKKAKKAIALIDKYLPDAKKYIKELKEKYQGDIAENLKELEKWKSYLDQLEKLDKESEEFKNLIKELSNIVVSKQDLIRKVVDFCNRDDVKDLAKKIKDATEGKADITGVIDKISKINVDNLVAVANMIIEGDYSKAEEFIKTLQDLVSSAEDMLNKLEKAEEYIATYEKNRKSYLAQIKEKEKEIKDGEKKLAAAKKKYQAQINAGWSTYYSEKAKYEAKLEEAKELLATNRELAEQKLAEARAMVKDIDCNWVVLDRKANAGYVDINSNIDAIASSGKVFGLLFMVVTAIVCLSTLIIIIDEQKKLVGTAKAFGFHKGEVLGKYLVFGISAAVVGAILAVIASVLLADFVQVKYAESRMYPLGAAKSIITMLPTVGSALILVAVTVIATIIACTGILRSPAAMLMKGTVLKKKKKKQKKTSSGKGSLYSRLIVRNMKEDLARVLITVFIVAFSCILIGLGITMKLAYDDMSKKQINEVNKYDMIMNLSDDKEDAKRQQLEKAMQGENLSYLSANKQALLYRWNDRLDGVSLVCADPNVISEYYAVTDPKTGEVLELPDDGVLIQKRMRESYGMQVGDTLPIIDGKLKEHEASIKGYFRNYVGRTVVVSPAAYKSIFGEAHEINCYYIKLNGANEDAVKEKLLAIDDDLSFETSGDFLSKFEGPSKLYNIIVFVTTGIAILISFMILTNLANIYLTRKKTELSVMRINGFSVKQTKGYLSRESIITTIAGLVLGVAIGALIAPPVISTLQQPDLEFVKDFHPIAWIIAVGLEAAFALIINNVVFNKVKKLNLRDIA